MPDPIQAEPTVPAGSGDKETNYGSFSKLGPMNDPERIRWVMKPNLSASGHLKMITDNPEITRLLEEQKGKVVDVETLTRFAKEIYGAKND